MGKETIYIKMSKEELEYKYRILDEAMNIGYPDDEDREAYNYIKETLTEATKLLERWQEQHECFCGDTTEYRCLLCATGDLLNKLKEKK